MAVKSPCAASDPCSIIEGSPEQGPVQLCMSAALSVLAPATAGSPLAGPCPNADPLRRQSKSMWAALCVDQLSSELICALPLRPASCMGSVLCSPLLAGVGSSRAAGLAASPAEGPAALILRHARLEERGGGEGWRDS